MVETALLGRFENLIRARCGIQMRAPEAALLSQTLLARAAVHRLASPLQYLDFLESLTLEARGEWNQLFVLLTNQESYFFRDAEQLGVIRDQILPALLQQRSHRTLRVWSAGCSTGEEPYTLAMMLEDALPAREEWRVTILGTDISEAALERARRGVYGDWSFRALSDATRARFFLRHGKEWQVRPELRQKVTFSPGNLFQDLFPTPGSELHEMDLILCRNVFIYFGRDEVGQVLRKFSATLRPQGFLVVGHAELHGAPLGDLQARAFPQSVVYQRAPKGLDSPEETPKPTLTAAIPRALAPLFRPARPLPAPPPPPAPRPTAAVKAALKAAIKPAAPAPKSHFTDSVSPDCVLEAGELIRGGHPQRALGMVEAALECEPKNLALLCLAAQAQANLGHLDAAETFCQKAIAVSGFEALPYQVLARIAAERGEAQQAKKWLKKVIYLSPTAVRAYLELGALYEREGDTARAAQMTRAALGVLDGHPDETPVAGENFAVEERLTAGEIKRQLEANRAS